MAIHWKGIPAGVCIGRDHYDLEVAEETKRMNAAYISGIVETKEHIAFHTGNVTCNRCKSWLKANKTRRAKMVDQTRSQ